MTLSEAFGHTSEGFGRISEGFWCTSEAFWRKTQMLGNRFNAPYMVYSNGYCRKPFTLHFLYVYRWVSVSWYGEGFFYPFTTLHSPSLSNCLRRLPLATHRRTDVFVIKTLRHYKFTMVKGGEGQWRVKRTLHQVISLIINYIHRLSEGWRVFAYFVANPFIITSPVSLSCMNAVLSPCRSWCPPTRFHLCSQRSSAGTFSDVSGLWQYLDCIKQNPWMAINYDNSLLYISIYCLLTLI